jgi:2-aminoethylphosphonate-pyruvate transaminase
MDALGFRRYLAPQHQGYIITAFHYPEHPNFNFATFYAALSAHGHLIYPGKLSQIDCFRVGHIGRIFAADVEALLAAIRATLAEMQVELPETRD